MLIQSLRTAEVSARVTRTLNDQLRSHQAESDSLALEVSALKAELHRERTLKDGYVYSELLSPFLDLKQTPE